MTAFSIAALVAQAGELPDWLYFPDAGENMPTISPEEAGVDPAKWASYLAAQSPHGEGYGGTRHREGEWGAVIVRGGYLLHAWSNPDFQYQTASLGKCFTRMVLILAVDDGLIGGEDDLICSHWTGERLLNSPHKYLDRGHHRALTFAHLKNMRGGFPVSDAYSWNKRIDDLAGGVPEWAKWTGDADYDNYAHAEPGTHRKYSSGGYWRLSQALTAIWNRDIKHVLDEKIMGRIGIRADEWEWVPGRDVHDNSSPGYDFYPDRPGYGLYLDPPYQVDGHVVRGGPGWVIMSARQLARVGLLVATGGWWNGEHLISEISGFNSVMGGTWGEGAPAYSAWGAVCTKGIEYPPGDLFTGPIHR